MYGSVANWDDHLAEGFEFLEEGVGDIGGGGSDEDSVEVDVGVECLRVRAVAGDDVGVLYL